MKTTFNTVVYLYTQNLFGNTSQILIIHCQMSRSHSVNILSGNVYVISNVMYLSHAVGTSVDAGPRSEVNATILSNWRDPNHCSVTAEYL